MNRDDILRMAREADLWMTSEERIAAVERFAALVSAAEREACAKVCEQSLAQYYMQQLLHINDEAFLLAACDECAAAIRARSNK